MTIYTIQHKRYLRWYIGGSILLTVAGFIAAIIENIIYATRQDQYSTAFGISYIACEITFISMAVALGVNGRGIMKGWRTTDLSMPTNKSKYARGLLKFVLTAYFILLIIPIIIIIFITYISGGFPDALTLNAIILSFSGDGYTPPPTLLFSIIGGTIYGLLVLAILSPSLATGYHRGSWGWWALIFLNIPLVLWFIPFDILSVVFFGISPAYLAIALLTAFILVVWGYINAVNYFTVKLDH